MLIAFDSGEQQEEDTFSGAYIQRVPQDLEFKPQYYVAEGDFFSLYPTVMMAHYISPESLITPDEQYAGRF